MRDWSFFEDLFSSRSFESNPNRSNRPNPSPSFEFTASLVLSMPLRLASWITLLTVVQINQPSHIFPLTSLPSNRSDSISSTSVRKQTFSRSSVGRSTASTPCARRWRYNRSFSCCSACCSACSSGLDEEYNPSGGGDRLGCGLSWWYMTWVGDVMQTKLDPCLAVLYARHRH